MDKLASSADFSGGIPILLIVALIGAAAALFGHFVVRSNAKLQAAIGEKTARLANEQSRDNAVLAASLSANVKLAEMRQTWLSDLRGEMTNFFALCNTKRMQPDAVKLNDIHRSGTKIELSMNPADEDYPPLRAAMFALYGDVPTGQTAEALDDAYLEICQRILKREWDRLQAEVRGVVDVKPAVGQADQIPPIPWYRRSS